VIEVEISVRALSGKNFQPLLLLRFLDTTGEGDVFDMLDMLESPGQDPIDNNGLSGRRSGVVTPRVAAVSVFRITEADLEVARILQLLKIVSERCR
jgi:hypothetical protein